MRIRSRPLRANSKNNAEAIVIKDKIWICHIPNFDSQQVDRHLLDQRRATIKGLQIPDYECPHSKDWCTWTENNDRYGPGDEFGDIPYATNFGILDLRGVNSDETENVAKILKTRLMSGFFVIVLTLYSDSPHTVLAVLDNDRKKMTICDPGRGHTKAANGGRIPKWLKNSNLAPKTKNRERIRTFAKHLGYTVKYGSDGEGLSALEQYKDSCAITCAVNALFYTSGATFVPKFDENTLRKIFCKMMEIAQRRKKIDIKFDNKIKPRKTACQDFINKLFSL